MCSCSFATGSEAGGERERTDERRRERENRTHTQTDHTSAETAKKQGQRLQPSPSESYTHTHILTYLSILSKGESVAVLAHLVLNASFIIKLEALNLLSKYLQLISEQILLRKKTKHMRVT